MLKTKNMVINSKHELLEHFDLYVSELSSSSSTSDKKWLKDLVKSVFSSHADINYNLAKDLFLHHKEMGKYDNYLTEVECDKIVQELHRAHGRGLKCSTKAELFRKLEERGLVIDHEPHFNKFALYAFMEHICITHSHVMGRLTDHISLDSGMSREEEEIKACYDLAVIHFKHAESDNFIREYFDID